MSNASQTAVMDPGDLAKARAAAKDLDISNSQTVVQFGVGAQKKIADLADSVLAEIRAKDADHVGESLGGLLERIKELDVGRLGTGGSFIDNIPILGGLVNSARRFISRYEKLSVKIEKIIDELHTALRGLLKDMQVLDTLFTRNDEYRKELDILLEAGRLKLEEVRSTVLPGLAEKAESSKDPADAQRLQDMNQLLVRFEKKLHDLRLSRMVALQASPQIRLIQNNNATLADKIQNSLFTAIPLWKSQIVIAVSLIRQKKALELQRQVSDTTNELMRKNSEMLKDGSLGVARESERGVVELETLKQVNNDLISTIEDTLNIQKEGKAKRQAAEAELAKMEDELKARLTAVQAG